MPFVPDSPKTFGRFVPDKPVVSPSSKPVESPGFDINAIPSVDVMGAATGYSEAPAAASQPAKTIEPSAMGQIGTEAKPLGFSDVGKQAALSGILGFFAPESLMVGGKALSGLPYGPAKAAGAGMQAAALGIGLPARVGSAASGALMGGAGKFAEKSALEKKLSPEHAATIGLLAETGTGLIAGLGTAGARYLYNLGRSALGGPAREAAQALRRGTTQIAQEALVEQQAIEENARKELERLSGPMQQIADAEARAQARAAVVTGIEAPPTATGAGQGIVQNIRERVLLRMQERARAAEQAAKNAKLTQSEALAHVATVEENVVAAEKAVKDLEARLVAGQQMTPEQLGPMLLSAARKIASNGVAARERGAKFGEAIASAGREPIVPTNNIINYINNTMQDVRDPTISSILNLVKNQLVTKTEQTGQQSINALNIESADSLRKYLDRALRTKQIEYGNGTMGSAAAALHHLQEIKNMLVKSATAAHAPYREALDKYRQLSRPLDIVERKGPLSRIVDVDNLSQESLRGSAEIAGAVIRQAKAGHPVFTRLLEIDPNIKNGARAYFYRELFGAGRVPNADRLRVFLKENEGVLQQLNLRDEFRTIAAARLSGQRALEAVQAELGLAKKAASEAGAAVRSAESIASDRRTVAEKAQKRLEEAFSVIGRQAKSATQTAEQAASRSRDIDLAIRELSNPSLAAKEIPAKARSILQGFADKGLISGDQYSQMIEQISKVEAAAKSTRESRVKLAKILAVGLGAGAVTQANTLIPRGF